MVQDNITRRYLQRIRRIFNKGLLVDLLSLLAPVFLLMVLFFMTVLTYGMSLLLIYFILPMFYAIDRRVRYDINGIGKRKLGFLDGYKAFFQSNKGGIFGVTLVIFAGLGLCVLCCVIVGLSIPNIVSCFPDAKPTYLDLMGKFSEGHTSRLEMMEFLMENIYKLTRPLTIYVGVSLFFPLFFIIFLGVNENLVFHYISSILFPDLDLNVSSSQSRSVAKSFSKGFTGYRLSETVKLNLPIYLLFGCMYGFALWGTSYIQVQDSSIVPLVTLIVPCGAVVMGTYMNHFCLANAYVVVEENTDVLRQSMPIAMQTSVYQTFHASEYVHGEESEARGSFIRSIGESSSMSKLEFGDAPRGVVVDFSDESTSKGDSQS